MSDITRILGRAASGDPQAVADLFPRVYEELRRLASQKMSHELPGQTLDATALVHEAYLRLIENSAPPYTPVSFANRAHFFAAAAEAMRRILIDNARRKQSVKHGGQRKRVPLEEAQRVLESSDDLLVLDDALLRLAEEDPVAVEIVKLRLYAGLSVEEAAEMLNIPRATAYRHWNYARAWIRCELA